MKRSVIYGKTSPSSSTIVSVSDDDKILIIKFEQSARKNYIVKMMSLLSDAYKRTRANNNDDI